MILLLSLILIKYLMLHLIVILTVFLGNSSLPNYFVVSILKERNLSSFCVTWLKSVLEHLRELDQMPLSLSGKPHQVSQYSLMVIIPPTRSPKPRQAGFVSYVQTLFRSACCRRPLWIVGDSVSLLVNPLLRNGSVVGFHFGWPPSPHWISRKPNSSQFEPLLYFKLIHLTFKSQQILFKGKTT